VKLATLAAAAILAVPFSAVATVVIAAPASAAPCTGAGLTTWQCVKCLQDVVATGQGSAAGCGETAGAPIAGNGLTGYPDCDVMISAFDRSDCLDQHLLGQR
jgi:hypothetical protein